MIWALLAAIFLGAVVNAAVLQDPEVTGALVVAVLVAAVYAAFRYHENRKPRP